MRYSEILAHSPLFDTLSDEDRDSLAAKLIERKFKSGDVVFAQGDHGNSMYVVKSGAVQIFLPGSRPDDPHVFVKDLHTAEFFGELSLFDDKPRSASVSAMDDTVLLELTRADFAEHLTKSRTAAMTILAEMAERLRETNALLTEHAAKDAVKEIEEHFTWGQRVADRVAELNGSWAFITFVIALTIGWMIANAIVRRPFDAYPYQFYNLALAILVALQGPLIMMSQNRQSMKERAQAETDFRVNLKNEIGIERIVNELGAFRAETNKRLELLERNARNESARLRVSDTTPAGSRSNHAG